MLVLPNGAKIDEDGLFKALDNDVAGKRFYLDALTGEVGIFNCGKKEQGKILDKDRYFEIPKIQEKIKLKWAKEFVKEMVYMEDESLAKKFCAILGAKNAKYSDFCKFLEKTDWRYGWPQWECDCAAEEERKWLDALPIEIEDNWEDELDDGCPLCQLLKQGSHTVEDFKEAAKKLRKRE